jgi:aryl sulfotransferase
MSALPQRTVEYNGFITEAHRWSSYRNRPDDIIIDTPPKCGTTWTQAICAMLVFGRADIDVQPGNISPWLDANFMPVEAVNGMLEGQTHRRFIKTHTPLDGIPFYPECQYLAVFRDPRDAYFSMANHLVNMNLPPDAPPMPARAETFEAWASEPLVHGQAQQLSLSFLLNHFKTFWNYRHLPNIHFFHYADMKRDLLGSVRAMAKAIGATLDEATLSAIADAAQFQNMRAKAKKYAPGSGSGIWKDETNFFDKARQGQWREILGEGDLAAYRKMMAATLPPDAVAWLEGGGPLPA